MLATFIFIYIYSKGNYFICVLSKFDRDLNLDEDAALKIQNQGEAQFFSDSGQVQ